MSELINRFIVVSDTHFGRDSDNSTDQVGVDDRTGPKVEPVSYEDRLQIMKNKLQEEKENDGLDFLIHNGDMVHSNMSEGQQAALTTFKTNYLDPLNIPYYVNLGNHDTVGDSTWSDLFKQSKNHSFVVGDYAFIILQTSDSSGERFLCTSKIFLRNELEKYQDKKGVFVFTHISRTNELEGFTGPSPNCEKITEVLARCNNLVCVVNSHHHYEYRHFRGRGVDYFWTGHFGHYGINFHGYRVFEIYDDTIKTKLINVTDDKVMTEHEIINVTNEKKSIFMGGSNELNKKNIMLKRKRTGRLFYGSNQL